MEIQILSNLHGDKKKSIDTSSIEGKRTAAQLVRELIRSGSALFLEKNVDGIDYTYRVTGYDESTDRIKISVHYDDAIPEGSEELKEKHKGRGRRGLMQRRAAVVSSAIGPIVSVAPVSGGVDSVEEQEIPTWKQIRAGLACLCEERGWHHGVPLPSQLDTSHRLILAKGTPFADQWGHDRPITAFPQNSVRICKNQDIDTDYERLVNSWIPEPTTIQVYRDSKGPFKARVPNSHVRLKFWIDTMAMRFGAMDWESEVKAMESLQSKITDSQWRSYIVSGMFPETSNRSGVSYILRKGLPTIAMTEKPLPDGNVQRHFLASLCIHPLGYYEETWAGCQPPTDEVIGVLSLIRADEHRLWKKSGQHPINDPRAGI